MYVCFFKSDPSRPELKNVQYAGVGFVLFSVWPQQFTFLVISAVVMGIGLGSYLAGTII